MTELLANPLLAGCGTAILVLVAVFGAGWAWHGLRQRSDRSSAQRDAIQMVAMQHLGTLDLPFYTVWCTKDAATANVVIDTDEESLESISRQIEAKLADAGYRCTVASRTFQEELANPGPQIESILILHRVTTCSHHGEEQGPQVGD